MTQPRILFLDHAAVLGGAELSLRDIAAHFRHQGRVALFEDGPLRQELEAAGVEVVVVPAATSVQAARRESGLGQAARSSFAVLSLLRRLRPLARDADVLYANSLKSLVIAAMLGRLTRRPVIWHLRDMLTEEHYSKANCRLTTRLASFAGARIITNSDATRQALIAAGGRADRAVTIHNGISPDALDAVTDDDARQARAEFRLPDDHFLVGVFSRLSPWKGQHVLLEAMRGIDGVSAIIVGDALFKEAEYRDRLRAMVKDLGLDGRVRMLGFRRDTPRLMKACDTVLHTSVSPEPFGRVIVEGMLARRPVIAADAGGATEILASPEQGIRVPAGDAGALAEAIIRLRDNPGLRQQLADGGRLRAEVAFSTGQMLRAIEAEVARVAEPAGATGSRNRSPAVGKMAGLGRASTFADGSHGDG